MFEPTIPKNQPYALTGAVEQGFPADRPEHDWASIGSALLRRRGVMLTVAGAVMFLVLAVTLLMPKTYTATVKLIAGDAGSNTGASSSANGPDSGLPVLNALMIASGVESAETFAELIRELPVAQGVIQNLKLDTTPQALVSHVTVKPVTNTSILAVSVSWSSPELAANIANEMASVFVSRERDIIASQATAALDFLSGELPRAAKRLSDAQMALAQFEEQHSIADIDSQTKDELTLMSTIASKTAQLQVDKRQAEAEIGTLSSEIGANSPTISGQSNVAPNPVKQTLLAQLAQVDVQLHTARQQLTDKHPTVIALEQQHSELEREIASQQSSISSGVTMIPNPIYQQLSQQVDNLRAQVASDAAQMSVLSGQRNAEVPRLRALPSETMRLSELKRDADSAEGVYAALQRKYNDAVVVKTTAISNVTVTDPASPATVVKTPHVLVNLAVGLLVSLALGVLAALAVEFLDDTVKDEKDVERRLSLPILSTIPRLDQTGRRALPWLRHLTVESFLQLISSIAYAGDSPVRTIAVTSPTKGDGKTTIASNVAIAMADLNPRVLIIDADMRRAAVHQRLGIENGLGLSDVLVGAVTLDNAIVGTRHPGLDCLTSGTLPPNPIKLLRSDRFKELLASAKERYHSIIIDCPALNPVYDAAIISTIADGYFMVVAANVTDVRSTKLALKRLRSTGMGNFLGIVLNMATVGERSHGGYYLEEPEEPLQLTSKSAS